MKVSVKDFPINMEIKSAGIELDIYSPDGSKHEGDVTITNTRLIWCRGRTQKKNGVAVKWEDFITWMESKK